MTYTVKPSEIYKGCTRAEIQSKLDKEGWKVIDFRPPKQGEVFLSTDLRVDHTVGLYPPAGFVRLILENTLSPDWWE